MSPVLMLHSLTQLPQRDGEASTESSGSAAAAGNGHECRWRQSSCCQTLGGRNLQLLLGKGGAKRGTDKSFRLFGFVLSLIWF